MSSPHFYQADDKYVQDVFGMNPNKEEHETVIDVNPVSLYKPDEKVWRIDQKLTFFSPHWTQNAAWSCTITASKNVFEVYALFMHLHVSK